MQVEELKKTIASLIEDKKNLLKRINVLEEKIEEMKKEKYFIKRAHKIGKIIKLMQEKKIINNSREEFEEQFKYLYNLDDIQLENFKNTILKINKNMTKESSIKLYQTKTDNITYDLYSEIQKIFD